MTGMNPYLMFAGNAEEAFNFYKSVFGGEFAFLQRMKDTPPQENKFSEEEQNQIMHVSLPVGKGLLMGSDAPSSSGFKINTGNNFNIAIDAESTQEADKLFKGLAAGGKVSMPMSNTFWGAYFGMLTDKFGIQWMISYTKPQQ